MNAVWLNSVTMCISFVTSFDLASGWKLDHFDFQFYELFFLHLNF